MLRRAREAGGGRQFRKSPKKAVAIEICNVGSRAVRSQFTKPPDDFDVFIRSLVCVDYDVGTGGDELWKQRTLEDIRGTG